MAHTFLDLKPLSQNYGLPNAKEDCLYLSAPSKEIPATSMATTLDIHCHGTQF